MSRKGSLSLAWKHRLCLYIEQGWFCDLGEADGVMDGIHRILITAHYMAGQADGLVRLISRALSHMYRTYLVPHSPIKPTHRAFKTLKYIHPGRAFPARISSSVQIHISFPTTSVPFTPMT
jgi:hypothetical protein